MCCLFSHPPSAPTLPPDWDRQSQQTILGVLKDTIPTAEATEQHKKQNNCVFKDCILTLYGETATLLRGILSIKC